MGSSTREGNIASPFSISRAGQDEQRDGALSTNGKILGTYIHGLFNSHALRRAMLEQIAEWKGVALPPQSDTGGQLSRDPEYDKLAETVRNSLDMDLLYQISGLAAPDID